MSQKLPEYGGISEQVDIPYTDVQNDDKFDFDTSDRHEAADMMHETEIRIHEGEVLTGRFYREENRLSYGDENRKVGEMPEKPLAERYSDADAEWERTVDDIAANHT